MIGHRHMWRISVLAVTPLVLSCSSGHGPSATNHTSPQSKASPPGSGSAIGATGPTLSTVPAPNSSVSSTTASGKAKPGAVPSTSASAGPVTLIEVADDPTYGRIVVDAEGHPLYVDDNDPAGGRPACTGSCTSTWAPLVVPPGSRPFGGTALTDLGTVTRPDGTRQATLKGRPLYRYLGDGASANVTGNGIGGVWHVALAPRT